MNAWRWALLTLLSCRIQPSAGIDAGMEPVETSQCGAAIALEPRMARTSLGVVRGLAAGPSVAFKGIAYAKPPLGPLRFRPPQTPECSSSVIEASGFGPACLQLDTMGKAVGSEDCLTLNVWAPMVEPDQPLPVLFFIHGGANISGSTSDLWLGEPAYDGQELSERAHAVVVTANYRLGALGFLALPSLSAESDQHVSGNYGLLDLLEALRWVQANAQAFGGDPQRVLVFGQSAGAHQTCALMASPLAAGLFSRAMMMSERCSVAPASSVEARGALVVKATHCESAADIPTCLRALDGSRLVEAVPGGHGVSGALNATSHYFTLNVDGQVLNESPIVALNAGRHHHVPFIIGTTAHETSAQIASLSSPLTTEADYRQLVHTLYGTDTGNRALAKYPLADYSSPYMALVTMTTDQRFLCQARRIARAADHGQTEPVRRYVFSYSTEHPNLQPYGAFHGIDVSFVFRTLRPNGASPSALDEEVSDRFIRLLSRFAERGDPNGGTDEVWPEFSEDRGGLVTLGQTITARADYAGSWCDFWDAEGF